MAPISTQPTTHKCSVDPSFPVEYTYSPADAVIAFSHTCFYFPAEILGAKFVALLDCGASENFMADTLARILGCRFHPLKTPLNVRLANGTRLSCTSFVRVRLHIHTWRTRLSFWVIPSTIPLILGIPFLTKYEPQLHWKDRTMVICEGNRTHILRADPILAPQADVSLTTPHSHTTPHLPTSSSENVVHTTCTPVVQKHVPLSFSPHLPIFEKPPPLDETEPSTEDWQEVTDLCDEDQVRNVFGKPFLLLRPYRRRTKFQPQFRKFWTTLLMSFQQSYPLTSHHPAQLTTTLNSNRVRDPPPIGFTGWLPPRMQL